MEKRKIYAIVLTLFVVLIFSGCTGSEENGQSNKKLPPFNSSIMGYIKNAEGNILENVKVTVTNSKYDWQDENMTSNTGFYNFSVFNGYFVITSNHEDYKKEQVGHNIKENQIIWINFSLTPIGDDFSFSLLNGKTDKLSNYRGKVVIMDMWATWCQPCQLVMPQLKEAYDDYSRDDLEIISINVDTNENAQMIQDFKDQFEEIGIELNWIFGKDDGSIWQKYKTGDGGIPTLCIFDQKGRLHFRKMGVVAYKEIPYYFPDDTPLLEPIINDLLK